jgi:hypothetical protein
LTPATWKFGGQQVGTTSAAATFTYTNTGVGSIKVSSVGFGEESSRQFVLGGDSCTPNLVLVSGNSCQFTIRFKPTMPDAASATVLVHDSSGGAAATGATLSGLGVAPRPGFGIAYYDYEATTTAMPHTFTLSNSGAAPLVVNQISLATGTQFTISTGGTCATSGAGATVGNGSSCTVIVTFTPSGTASFGDTLSVTGTGIGIGASSYTATLGLKGH